MVVREEWREAVRVMWQGQETVVHRLPRLVHDYQQQQQQQDEEDEEEEESIAEIAFGGERAKQAQGKWVAAVGNRGAVGLWGEGGQERGKARVSLDGEIVCGEGIGGTEDGKYLFIVSHTGDKRIETRNSISLLSVFRVGDNEIVNVAQTPIINTHNLIDICYIGTDNNNSHIIILAIQKIALVVLQFNPDNNRIRYIYKIDFSNLEITTTEHDDGNIWVLNINSSNPNENGRLTKVNIEEILTLSSLNK